MEIYLSCYQYDFCNIHDYFKAIYSSVLVLSFPFSLSYSHIPQLFMNRCLMLWGFIYLFNLSSMIPYLENKLVQILYSDTDNLQGCFKTCHFNSAHTEKGKGTTCAILVHVQILNSPNLEFFGSWFSQKCIKH